MTATDRQAFRGLGYALRALSAFAIVTGLLDVGAGPALLPALGSSLSADALSDPVLDSQMRYLGAMWSGVGALLWWTTGAPRERTSALYIMLSAIFLGGAGRVAGAIRRGAGPPILPVFTVVELVGAVILLSWHRNIITTLPPPQSQL